MCQYHELYSPFWRDKSVYQSSLPAYFILIQIINLEERTSAEDEKPMDPWPERIHRRSFNFTMIWVIQIQIIP